MRESQTVTPGSFQRISHCFVLLNWKLFYKLYQTFVLTLVSKAQTWKFYGPNAWACVAETTFWRLIQIFCHESYKNMQTLDILIMACKKPKVFRHALTEGKEKWMQSIHITVVLCFVYWGTVWATWAKKTTRKITKGIQTNRFKKVSSMKVVRRKFISEHGGSQSELLWKQCCNRLNLWHRTVKICTNCLIITLQTK